MPVFWDVSACPGCLQPCFSECADTCPYGSCSLLLSVTGAAGLFPAPDGNGDPFSMEGSLVGYVDRMFLPGQLYLGIHDPEGLLGIIPAVGTASLGMLTGEWIKREGLPELRKVVLLACAGVMLVVVGWIWDLVFPINKNLWTSSFACLVGGISMLLFALFYYLIDVRHCHRWTLFFRVIGMNSITSIWLSASLI